MIAQKLFTLSEGSAEVIKAVTDKVTILAVYPKGREEMMVKSLLDEYQKCSQKVAVDAARQTDISIVGVGGQPSQEYCREAGYDFTIEEIEQLIALNSVGDMCANFFDVQGNSSIIKISSRLIAVGLKDIKKMKKVICIGGWTKQA